MSAVPRDGPVAARSPVLLVVVGGTVSQAAISRTAEIAAGAPVTVVGTAPPGTVSTEQVRRAVALAMSVLGNTGVMALGHIAVSSSPARAVARVARSRGARAVVVDQARGLAAELRRRMYGSGIVVVCAPDSGGPGMAASS